MSLKLKSIESVFRPVITAAFKSLESKTYDTSREDYMDVLLEDLFQILFPKPKETEKKKPKSTSSTQALTTPTEEKEKPGPKPKTPPQSPEQSETKEKKKPGPKPKTPPQSPESTEKKKPGPKPKVDENGNRINSPRNRSPKPEEEKKKPGPKPKLDENGNPVNPPRNRKKKEAAPSPPPSPPKKENVPLPPSPVHIKKVDPTIRKKLKESAKKNKMDFEKEHETKFLEWVNALSVEEFKASETVITDKYFEQLTKATVPPPSPENPPQPPKPTSESKEEEEESDLTEAFGEKGESYWVDKQTGRVYEGEGEIDEETGAYANYKPLGYLGEGVFKNLKV